MCETLQFLDIMCGSTTGGLGLLGLYINEDNVGLVIQTLETLTEYCQGPCHENQVSSLRVACACEGGGAGGGGATVTDRPGNCISRWPCQTCIVTHESNGIDIITALILNDISPLCKYRMDLVLQLKVGPPSGERAGCACEICVFTCEWQGYVAWVAPCCALGEMCRLHWLHRDTGVNTAHSSCVPRRTSCVYAGGWGVGARSLRVFTQGGLEGDNTLGASQHPRALRRW